MLMLLASSKAAWILWIIISVHSNYRSSWWWRHDGKFKNIRAACDIRYLSRESLTSLCQRMIAQSQHRQKLQLYELLSICTVCWFSRIICYWSLYVRRGQAEQFFWLSIKAWYRQDTKSNQHHGRYTQLQDTTICFHTAIEKVWSNGQRQRR